jgi:hypothetical protein
VLGVIAPPSTTVVTIFTKILNWHCRKNTFGASHPFATGLDTYVKATLDVYDAALAVLKPTPTKSHYVFSTCDVRRVVQGTMLARLKQLPDGACVGVGCWLLGGGVGWCWLVLLAGVWYCWLVLLAGVVGWCCWLVLLAVVGNTTCVTVNIPSPCQKTMIQPRSPLGPVLISAFDICDFFLNTTTDHSESGGSR